MREKHGIQEREPTEENSKGKFKGEICEAGHGRNWLDRGLKRAVSRTEKLGSADYLLKWGKGGTGLPAQQPVPSLSMLLGTVWAAICPALRMKWD